MSMIAVSRQVLDRHSINAVDTSRGGVHELGDRSDTPIGRLTKIRQAIVSGVTTRYARFLAARQGRADTEIARLRDDRDTSG